jgi:3-oxoadipate enol-lactonase
MEKLYKIKSSIFPVIAYRKFGAGPALVLLHGFPEDGGLWKPVWDMLAKQFTVIVPDLPGSGGSTWDSENITIEQMAESVHEVLRHEQVEMAVVAGHSMGGYTAMAFADMYPECLQGLSMVHSLATADTDEKKETRRKSIELIRKGGNQPFVKQMIPNLFAKAYKEGHPDIIKQQVERGLKLKPVNLIAFYNAMINRPDRTRILSKLGCAVQWIIGKEDNIASPENVLKQSKLAIVNFVSIYKGCGHMSMLEKPELLAKDLGDFSSYCYRLNK